MPEARLPGRKCLNLCANRPPLGLGVFGQSPISRIVLAYSGGLDTSVAIVWLQEFYEAEVVTVTVDVGQGDDLDEIASRAEKLGAVKHYNIDARREFAENYVYPSIRANALYEDKYPLGTALARPLIARKLVEVARREGADAVAHGCTSKGNDQVRFDLTVKAYAPDLEIIAPARVWGMSRSEELEYARRKGIPIPSTHKRFSIDANLWSRSIEGPEIDDPAAPVPEDAFEWTVAPERAPDRPLILELGFREGVPVSVNGEELEPLQLVEKLNRLLGLHGYGRVDHVENRVVGFKSREVYEAPAALAIIEAHKDLEKLVFTPRELRFKRLVDALWTDLVYQGLWVEPLRRHLDTLIASMEKYVEGSVKLKVYKGSLTILGRSSRYAGYSEQLASYVEGWYPSDEEARGFIEMWGLHSLLALRARGLNKG